MDQRVLLPVWDLLCVLCPIIRINHPLFLWTSLSSPVSDACIHFFYFVPLLFNVPLVHLPFYYCVIPLWAGYACRTMLVLAIATAYVCCHRPLPQLLTLA